MRYQVLGGLFLERVDDRNWALKEVRTAEKSGKTYEISLGYWGSLDQAARGAMEHLIGMGEGTTGLTELIQEVHSARKAVLEAFKGR